MTVRIRLGAVGYLNARPLTWSLDRSPHRWDIRYDVPSVCAALLRDGEVDLGLVPSIEYLRASDYRLVPGVGIGSTGPIASVAMYSRVPVGDITRLALDTSSRTSVALVQVLCHHHFHIAPELVPFGPDLAAMTRACDAGLLIGDPAFDADHEALGLRKIDLGAEWTAFTGMPFVYAAWTGRAGAVGPDDVEALQQAQADGVDAVDAIAAEYAARHAAASARRRPDEAAEHQGVGLQQEPDLASRAARYLRDNVKYGLGAREAAGLQLFLDYAADLGLGPSRRVLEFF